MSVQALPRQLFLSGLKKASAAHKDSLAAAQWLAEMIGHQQETVTADDVTKYISSKALGNASGAIFRNGPWEVVGFHRSQREDRRAGFQLKWRLRANAERGA